MKEHEQNQQQNELAKQLYEHLKSRYKFTLRNRQKSAPKPVENPDTEQHPEERQNAFLGEMNSLQKFQNDLWEKGTV